jgi:para-nitrobenzyl esterase
MIGDYWVRFARTGDPNGSGAVRWPAVSAAPTAYLHMDATPRAERLAPAEEKAKAASMAAAVRAWSSPSTP